MYVYFRQLQYDSLFTLSSESLGHVGRRFINYYHYNYVHVHAFNRAPATLTIHAKATIRQQDKSGVYSGNCGKDAGGKWETTNHIGVA